MDLTVNQAAYAFGGSNPSLPTFSNLMFVALCEKIPSNAEVAQLIEHQPSKLRVAGLSPVFRSEPL